MRRRTGRTRRFELKQAVMREVINKIPIVPGNNRSKWHLKEDFRGQDLIHQSSSSIFIVAKLQ